MAASVGDSHPYPIYNARYRAHFPILNNTGALVTAAAGLDSEVSQDDGTFADCANEAAELATSSGMYYLDLVAAELDVQVASIIVKTTTTDAKTTPIVLYPKRLPVLRTGTAQAGASNTITLDSAASDIDDFYVGMYVNITNNTPANAQGQARLIIDYVGSSKVATVQSNWGTNPSSSSTFEILVPAEMGLGQYVDAWSSRVIQAGAFANDSTSARTNMQAQRLMRNRWAQSGATLTVYKEDDTTTAWTSSITNTAGANPVTASDPS